jgi:hypothetical protein
MRRALAERGYRHCSSDDEFTRHGDYARNMQYVCSKEFKCDHEKIIDLIYLSTDLLSEKIVIGFFRENVSIENGVLENADISIPLFKFSIETFETALDRLIPKEAPFRQKRKPRNTF